MSETANTNAAINWYRTPLPRETLSALNARSDLKGAIQTLAVLGTLVATGAATLWAAFNGHWLMVPLLLLLHGTVGSFHINAVHELGHGYLSPPSCRSVPPTGIGCNGPATRPSTLA